MDEILHHFEAMGNHLFVGFYRGIIILRLLRWFEMDFATTHSMENPDQSPKNTSLPPIESDVGASP